MLFYGCLEWALLPLTPHWQTETECRCGRYNPDLRYVTDVFDHSDGGPGRRQWLAPDSHPSHHNRPTITNMSFDLNDGFIILRKKNSERVCFLPSYQQGLAHDDLCFKDFLGE